MTPARQKLIEVLKNRALLKGAHLTLASGQASGGIYVDCKRITLHGPSLKVVSHAVVDFFNEKGLRPKQVAGVSVGGDPLVAGVLLEANSLGWELSGLLVRKEPKKHGASQGKAVDGPAPEAGQSVWLLEDVVSTGGSSLKAAHYLRDEGYHLGGVLCLVDREMGGIWSLADNLQVPVLSLVTLSQLK